MTRTKITFTLRDATISGLRRAAERLGRPRSEVIREAIRDHSDLVGRLSEAERSHLLAAFDCVVPAIPSRPLVEVEGEIRAVREARRGGGNFS